MTPRRTAPSAGRPWSAHWRAGRGVGDATILADADAARQVDYREREMGEAALDRLLAAIEAE